MTEKNIRLALFCCENSAYLLAEAVGGQLPAGVEVVRVPCGGRVEHVQMLRTLQAADGVLTLACLAENCKHFRGNTRGKKRTEYISTQVEQIGLDKNRVGYGEVAANDTHKFLELVNDFYAQLQEMGPIEGKVS